MKKYFLLFLLTLSMVGCGLESKYALPEKLPINPDLVGVWKDADNGNGMILITKKNKTRYTIEVVFDATRKEENLKFEAYEVRIGNSNILNLVEKNDEGQNFYIFYTYTLEGGDILTFREVTDKASETDKASGEAILNYFRKNIDKQDFFGESIKMLRLK